MVVVLFIFCFLKSINGFLLEPENGKVQTGSSNQYLTVSAFLDAKTQQQNGMDSLHHEMEQLRHENEQLRHDTNQMLNVLASQLKDKFSSFELKNGQNGNESHTCEENYEELLRNYTIMQQNSQTVTNYFSVLQKEFIKMQNDSDELARELKDLKQLKNIQTLLDFKTLQQQVQSINSQTHSLSVKEQARTQDFLALYNVTKESKTAISTLNQTMYDLEVSQNTKFNKKIEGLHGNFNKTTHLFTEKLDQVENMSNATFVGLQDQINRNAEKVALTACLYSDEYSHSRSSGYIIKFSDVRNKVGIQHLSSFTNDGKFTCEKAGLYLIAITFLTKTQYGRVGIYKNGYPLTSTFNTGENNNIAYSSTAVAAVDLQHGDKIWIQVEDRKTYNYSGNWHDSCITIVKVM